MPSFRKGILIFLATLAFPWQAVSEESKPFTGNDVAPPETVVVTGRRPDQKTLDEVVRGFVESHGKTSSKVDHLTRWYEPVCPEVRNLPPGFGLFIVKRIKAIAASVGAPVKDICKLNVEIIFTSEPQVLLDKVALMDPRLLGFHFVHQTKQLATMTAPIEAWYVTGTSNGVETYIDDPYHGTPGGPPGSRLQDGLYSVFNHVLIIVNTDKVAGYPIGPIADYIAMLALSQAKAPDDCVSLSSILDYLSAGCSEKPQSLTFADKTFLEGLYAVDKSEYGSLERSNIAEHMQQSLKGE